MAFIAMVPHKARKDGKRYVENVVQPPEHVFKVDKDGPRLIPGMWFPSPDCDCFLLEDGSGVGIGYSYDPDTGVFTSPHPPATE